ncbi:MAG: Gfo/Idh/MocA family oxidoreductase [Planctomycetota bacterium]|nr:MAG: Gfo/Idh/MocA family oxidoreductase [Planctomycetota bacterium]
MKGISRRKFIRGSLGSVAAAGVVARSAAGQDAVVGANERIRVALIGSGGMGRGDLRTFFQHKEVDCPVVCDVDDAMIANAVKTVEKNRRKTPDTTKDFRSIMDRKDVDACIVGTPDHWHALPTIHACQAGKDVYVEKPLATTIGEGRAMVEAARKYNRVVQMGTQWRVGKHWGEAVDYVHSGKLGKIRLVRCWAALGWFNSVGKVEDSPTPAGVDYDMWLGPAPSRPFNKARFHFTFRWFWDYAGGLMTDWGVHLINIAMWAMKAKTPIQVSSVGGKFAFDDMAETPDTQSAIYDFKDFMLIWEHQAGTGHGAEGREHGVAFYGTNGTLIVDHTNGWEVVPEPKKGLEPIKKRKAKGRDSRFRLAGDFLNCMRSRQRSVMDVEVGHRVSAVAHLGNIALISKRVIGWDAEKERIIGHDDLDHLVTKPYRAPWKLKV